MTTDPNQIGMLRTFSAVLERMGITRRTGGDSNRRNMAEILGRKDKLGYGDFSARYDRKDIAGRIVDIVPQIYPEPTVPAYLVCGTMIEGRSFTRSEQDALIDYQAEQGLEEKINKLSKMQIE